MEIAESPCIARKFREDEIQTNACIKRYPDGYRIAVWNRPVYTPQGWEVCDESKRKASIHEPVQCVRADSARRAKAAIFDISSLNEWAYFVTLTLDAGKVDRYDPKEIIKPFCKWLQNMVQRRGIRYLFVPEHHKDGAIHFHGLITEGLHMSDSGTLRFQGRKKPVKVSTAKRLRLDPADGQTIFNIDDFKLGFSSALCVYGERENLAKYMTKYITKDLSKIFGNFYFAGGHDLRRHPPKTMLDIDFERVKSPTFGGDFGMVKYVFMPSKEALSDFLLSTVDRLLTRQEAFSLYG